MTNKYKNIVLTANSGEAHFQNPRALIAIFPYKIRKITPIKAVQNKDKITELNGYLDLRSDPIVISSDVLSMSISTRKQGLFHNMSCVLASGKNYLSLMAPGDYAMCWLVNSNTKLEELINRLQTNRSVNDYDSGLKFFGKVHTIQETFQVSGGIKEVRYRLNGIGFDQYNGQVYFSPFLNLGEQGTPSNQLFIDKFFSNIQKDNQSFTAVLAKDRFSIHDQFIFWHKALLGPGSGQTGNSVSPITTVNGTFGIPKSVAQAFNRDINLNSSQFHTYADLVNVIVGIQQFDQGGNGVLGPDFILRDYVRNEGGRKYGMYWEPQNEKFKLPGRKIINITPNFNSTIISILQQHSNPLINEMYFCLRPEPSPLAPIVPTLVCRQIPFTTNTNFAQSQAGKISSINISSDNVPFTLYLDLPRFQINNSLVRSYEFSRSEALRVNCVTVSSAVDLAFPNAGLFLESLAIGNGGWIFDINDCKRNGLKSYQAKIDQDYFDLSNQQQDNVKKIDAYNFLITDFTANMHLRYTGTLNCVGIVEPICIGENLEYNDFVFHIEGVDHLYAIEQPSGIANFSTVLSLSHGIHKSGDLEAIDSINGNDRSNFATNSKTKNLYKDTGGYTEENVPNNISSNFFNKISDFNPSGFGNIG